MTVFIIVISVFTTHMGKLISHKNICFSQIAQDRFLNITMSNSYYEAKEVKIQLKERQTKSNKEIGLDVYNGATCRHTTKSSCILFFWELVFLKTFPRNQGTRSIKIFRNIIYYGLYH
jgi:hypothetical protein